MMQRLASARIFHAVSKAYTMVLLTIGIALSDSLSGREGCPLLD